MAEEGSLGEEMRRLRDWRHEVVSPALAATREQLKAHEERLSRLEPQVARMARADEIADAVRRSLFTTTEKLAAALVGALGIASLISQWLH